LILIIFFFIFEWHGQRVLNFDANATTQMNNAGISAINYAYRKPLLNPSSAYASVEKVILDDFKKFILQKVGKPNHICILTSGASESNNLLFRGCGLPVYCSPYEHKTSLECPGVQIYKSTVPCGSLLSIMAINNETGNSFGRYLHRRPGVILHSDIAQYFGKIETPHSPIDITEVDCFSISFHKAHGAVGLGALIIPQDMTLNPQIVGTQNNGLRGGTENIQAIYGTFMALQEVFKNRTAKNARLREMKKKLMTVLAADRCILEQPISFSPFSSQCDEERGEREEEAYYNTCCLNKPGIMFLNIPETDSSINTVLVSFIHNKIGYRFCNIAFRDYLAKKNVFVSIGSACNTTRKGASHILHELRLPFIVRCGVIRFSLSDDNSDLDIYELQKRL
jgi:cysteine desulfurase